MLVSSIYDQIKEVTGLCDQTVNFQAISRAVELLANEGLFDPLIGFLNFNNSDTNLVTLPRDVKTVLRVNINTNPTFFRNRLFEFTLNTNGSGDGEELGFAWSDRGYSPIQDENKLPGKLAYVCEVDDDIGLTCQVIGRDANGQEVREVLAAARAAVFSSNTFYKVDKIVRDPSAGTCLLFCVDNTKLAAQYYPDETDPMYRVIKLSKKVSSVHMMFRREVFEITSMDDLIPMQSKMAVIHAAKAVRYFANDEYEKGDAALARAIDFAKKEQMSRDEQDAMANALEIPTATDTSINCRDSIIVADVYDAACEIFGYLGRPKIFDKITTAMEVLRNKAHWDADLGVVDIWTTDRTEDINVRHGKGSGYFVLPRFVESIVSLNLCNRPQIARNRWFEFHLNGTGETNRASCGTWDDAGEVAIIREPARDPDTHLVIPFQVVAIPVSTLDNNKVVTIYGSEQLDNGDIREVIRNGAPGYQVPCVAGSYAVGTGAPNWVEITRITRDATTDFVRLVVTDGTSEYDLLGYWYPDEVEPKYRAIRIASAKATRIRVLYRRRTMKISSLFQPIPLRSRLAIENMMRALKLQPTDPVAASGFEQMAVNYLSEERINSTPSDAGSLQFDDATMPGFTGNLT